MSGINKVILIGHLGQDPDIKYTADGTAVANFSIATSEEWTDKNTGEKKQRTEWHRIVVWRRLAEICGEYISKGSQVFIEGKLQTRKWEDKDNITHYITEVIANNVQFLSSKSTGNENVSAESGIPKSEVTPEGDDIPF